MDICRAVLYIGSRHDDSALCLRMKDSKLISGLLAHRITYWLRQHCISAAELASLGDTNTAVAAAAAAASQPPALELGTEKGDVLRVEHEPRLASVSSSGDVLGPLELSIQRHTAEIEDTLCAAAAATAAIQLGM